MPALATFPFPSLDSLSTICSRDGYTTLPEKQKNGPKIKGTVTKKRSFVKKKSKLSSFVHVAHRAFLALFRNWCFHVSETTDNDSLLAGGQEKVLPAMIPPSKPQINPYSSELSLADKIDDLSWDSSADFLESVAYTVLQPWTSTPCKAKVITTSVSTKEMQEAQLRRSVMVSSGMKKLEDSRTSVLESRHRLEALKTDIVAVRSDIQKAQAIFSEVERGIKDYKWELVDRDSWTVLLHPKVLYSSPGKIFGKSHMQQMYREHRIFVEEMKYHFKWQHGIII